MISAPNYIGGPYFEGNSKKMHFRFYFRHFAESQVGSILKTKHLSSATSLFKNDQRPKLHRWTLLWRKFEKNAISLPFAALCRKSTGVFLENQAPKLRDILIQKLSAPQIAFSLLFAAIFLCNSRNFFWQCFFTGVQITWTIVKSYMHGQTN